MNRHSLRKRAREAVDRTAHLITKLPPDSPFALEWQRLRDEMTFCSNAELADNAARQLDFCTRLEAYNNLLARQGALTPCEHDWPEAADGSGTDMDGRCTKCLMAFQYYIHVEMP